MAASNTRECFKELIGHKVIGVLFDALPAYSPELRPGTTTIVLEDGSGLTLNLSRGSYWRETKKDIKRAIEPKWQELTRTWSELAAVLDLAGALKDGAE